MVKLMNLYEPINNADLFYFIKSNKKVTIEEIKDEFPTYDEVINLHNFIEVDLQELINIGKVRLEDGYYIANTEQDKIK
jgi:hypothetical protein